MTQATNQLVQPQLPQRLGERLEGLGVAVVLIGADSRPSLQGPVRPLERLLVNAPAFAAALKSPDVIGKLAECVAGQVVEVWPGVWLAPLAIRRRRHGAAEKARPQSLAVVLLGPEFLASDQMHLICDNAGVDFQSTVSAVDRNHLFEAAEALRLANTLAWMHQDSLEIERRFGELQTMGAQLGESYEELSLLYKLSTSMTVNQPPAEFLMNACRELRQVLGLKWMSLHLTSSEPRLNELADWVFTACDSAAPSATGDSELVKRLGKQLMLQLPEDYKPWIIDDTHTLAIPEVEGLARELLVVPMLRESKPFGLLYGGDKIAGTRISSIDSKLCDSLANSLAIFLENRMLFEDMSAMFMGTLHALTSSIDAKDRYTKGHSERVAIMSRRLAAAAGLDEQMVERVYISGLIHDVGKIGVPEAVLTKPGRLTDEEFALIKLHPEIGAQILRDIPQMNDLVPGVLYHHERWDGRGYPSKLAGNNIPLFGRLICLADSFDAMSSTRTYRKSLKLEDVLQEIRRCAGTQFDPVLAEIFVKLDFTEFFNMLREHQQMAEGSGFRVQDSGNSAAPADASPSSPNPEPRTPNPEGKP